MKFVTTYASPGGGRVCSPSRLVTPVGPLAHALLPSVKNGIPEEGDISDK